MSITTDKRLKLRYPGREALLLVVAKRATPALVFDEAVCTQS